MKNYVVKALFGFNDMEEKTEAGTDTPRKKDDVFNCTKERYEYLKSRNAVTLVGIDEIKEESKKEVKEDLKTETKKEPSKTNIYKEDKMSYNKPTKKGRKKKEV